MDGLETKTILEMDGGASYIQNMRSTSTWGGAIEIQAACNIWKLKCTVKDIRTSGGKDIEFIPISGPHDKDIRVTWNGVSLRTYSVIYLLFIGFHGRKNHAH